MCKTKLEEVSCPTLRTMEVKVDDLVVKVNFNIFEINKKTFRVGIAPDGREKVMFSKISPLKPEDQSYLDYVEKRYNLIATAQIKAQKDTEKKLAKRRA
ncbi:MAG: hypothetical protein WCK59_01050 [Candidatus Falkowbacteria bacterium]